MTHDMGENNGSKDCEHLRNQRGQKTVDQCLQSAERLRMRQGLYLREVEMQADYSLWVQVQEMGQKSRD